MEVWIIVIMVLGAILIGYVTTSVVLFCFPTLLRKKKNLSFKCRHISHRGGAGEHLENTMAAFKHAVSVGTDMLELDVQITKDGYVVVSHDDNLKRVTGYDIAISETDYADLPPLKTNLKLDFDSYHLTQKEDDADRKIAQLRDVFAEFPKLPINVDVKNNSDELINKVHLQIKEFNRENITVWGNFSNEVANKLYAVDPSIPLFFSLRRTATLLLYFYTGLLPFVPLRESCFEIPLPRMLLNKNRFDPSRFSCFMRFLVRCVHGLMIRKCLIRHLEKRGIQTFSWVLNEDHEFEVSLKQGFTGIMTDFPTKLNSFLTSREPNEKTTLNGNLL